VEVPLVDSVEDPVADRPVAHVLDLLDVRRRLRLDLVGERLHREGAAERVDDVGRARLLGDDLLGAERDPDRLLGGQRQRLVEGVGVEALGATEHARQRLNRDPHDVI